MKTFPILIVIITCCGLTYAIRGNRRDLLVDQIREADRIEIESTAFKSGKSDQPLASILGREKVDEFIQLLEISEEQSGGHCACDGDALLIFKQGDAVLAEVGYHHSRSLRWHDGKWFGDAALADRSQAALPEWFFDQGFPNFYRSAHSDRARNVRYQADLARFKSFFTEEEIKLLTMDNSEKQLEATGDRAGFAARVFLALGMPLGCNELSNTRVWWNAVSAAGEVSDAEFEMALEQVHHDPWGLLGAKEPFFRGRYDDRFDPEERTYWTLKIADAALTSGRDYDKQELLRKVAQLDCPSSSEFLRDVARGEIGREIDYRRAHTYYGGVRSAAYLFLALDGHVQYADEMKELLASARAPQDIATLRAALAVSGELSYLTPDVYNSQIDYVQEAFLTAVERSRNVETVELLVEMLRGEINGEDGPYFGPDEYITLENAVGQKLRTEKELKQDRWYPDEEHLKKALAWWVENKEELNRRWTQQ